MNTIQFNNFKMDLERIAIGIGLTLMEVTGVVFLVCRMFDIKII